MALDAVKNFAKVTVSTGYDASATSIVLTTGHGARLPAAPFNLTWWNSTDYGDPSDDPNVEIVRCTATATDTLTVTRSQESTSASTKNTAARTYKMIAGITAKVISTDIFASPTIVTPTIGSFVNAGHSHLNAAGGGTITAAAISDLAHNLLSATHGDTTAAAVQRGDLVAGIGASAKWERLAKPSVLSGLSHDGTDVSWVTATGTGAPVRATSPVLVTPMLGASAATSVAINSSTLIGGASANSIEQRNGTNAQVFNLYNTYTDVSNYERLSTKYASNIITFSSEAGGTGTIRNFAFTGGNTAFGTTTAPVGTTVHVSGRLQMSGATADFYISSRNAGADFALYSQSSVLLLYSSGVGSSVLNISSTGDITTFGSLTIADAKNLVLNTTTGTKIGTATGQKIGFWNATPVVQQVLATGAGATADNIITMLQTLGLCKQS